MLFFLQMPTLLGAPCTPVVLIMWWFFYIWIGIMFLMARCMGCHRLLQILLAEIQYYQFVSLLYTVFWNVWRCSKKVLSMKNGFHHPSEWALPFLPLAIFHNWVLFQQNAILAIFFYFLFFQWPWVQAFKNKCIWLYCVMSNKSIAKLRLIWRSKGNDS